MGKVAKTRVLQGRDIRAERCRHRLTQVQLAAKLETYMGTLVSIEREHVQLSQEEYRRILDAIDELAGSPR